MYMVVFAFFGGIMGYRIANCFKQSIILIILSAMSLVQANSKDDFARKIMNDEVPAFNNDSLSWGSTSLPSNKNFNTFNDLYDEIHTDSRGVLVVDLQNDSVVYEKNADVSRPIASITKIMTAMVILDARQDMEEQIFLDSEDFRGALRASSRLRVADRLNRAELLLIMLMKSENPAAKSLARHYPGGYDAFIAAMNAKAQSLGMYSTWFSDSSGLDYRNQSSPRDLAKMVKAAGNYGLIRQFSTTKKYDFYLDNRVLAANNTSVLVRNGQYNIGISKTGYIRKAGKCYVMETMINGRPSAVIILGAKSSRVRWRDAENILGYLSRRYKQT